MENQVQNQEIQEVKKTRTSIWQKTLLLVREGTTISGDAAFLKEEHKKDCILLNLDKFLGNFAITNEEDIKALSNYIYENKEELKNILANKN